MTAGEAACELGDLSVSHGNLPLVVGNKAVEGFEVVPAGPGGVPVLRLILTRETPAWRSDEWLDTPNDDAGLQKLEED